MSTKYDVIVVGAGPSGSTAARTLVELGCSTLLLEKKIFPRPKTCAAWVNALAFERFPCLRAALPQLVESPFYGIRFYDGDFQRHGTYQETKPAGYLALRAKFDQALAGLAEKSGAVLRQKACVRAVEDGKDEVAVRLDDGSVFTSRFVIGADGVNSGVALWAGIRESWRRDQYVLCANEDIPYEQGRIASFYGARVLLIVSLRFRGLNGYGWVWPKREHICVGIGGRLAAGEDIRTLMERFCACAREGGVLPQDAVLQNPDYALDPAGAVHNLSGLTRGKVVLIGDAGGFVSGRTGEGIYPGMLSGALAAEVIRSALDRGSSDLSEFNRRWRGPLGDYLRSLPGGEKSESTRSRLELIFSSRQAAAVAGRMFLYGETLSLRTLLRAAF